MVGQTPDGPIRRDMHSERGAADPGVTKVQLHAVGGVEMAPAEAALGLKPR